MSLRARTEQALQSVPPDDGVIVFHWPTKNLLASRAPRHPAIEHHAYLIVLDGPEPIGPRVPAGRSGEPVEGSPWGAAGVAGGAS
jgi:hypothetical protein